MRCIVRLLGLVLFVVSCNRPVPQLPANKIINTDSTSSTILNINKVLISKEDSVLSDYVGRNEPGFTRHNLGFWYRIELKTSRSLLKYKEKCTCEVLIFDLSDNLLEQKELNFQIGKRETIKGLEEALKIMHHGEKAILVLPWYLGYGMSGNGSTVPPYTSLKIKVELQ